MEQKLRSDEPDAVAYGRIEIGQLAGVGNIEHDPNRRTVGGYARPHRRISRQRTRRGGRFRIAVELRTSGGTRVDDQHSAMRIDERLTTKLGEIDTETHDRRNAAGAREHPHVAGGTAGGQHERPAARPIDGEESRRREVDRSHDRSGGHYSLDRGSRQMREHPITKVTKVRPARPKIFVVGRLVTGDFLLHSSEPRVIRGTPRGDGRESGLGEHLVLKERDLEFQDCHRVPGRPRDEAVQIHHCGVQR